MKRIFLPVVMCALGLSLVAASEAFASGVCPIQPVEIHSSQEAAKLAVKAAEIYKLSPIPLKCATYQSDDDDGKSGPYRVSFYENHTPECGGEPDIAPRLFTIIVTSKGRMKTDAYGEDMATGKYRPLKCPK